MKNNEKFIKNFELDEAAVQLLKALEKEDSRIKDFLTRSYKGLPVSPEMEEVAYNYFITHSLFTAATVANPGSSVITEFLYEGNSSPFPIDNYFLHAKAGKAVKARLIAIEKEVPDIIEEYRSKGNVLICNLGSGPGRDIINILYHYRNASNVRAIHIDKDKVALERGKRIAKNKRVSHLIEFIQGNFLKYNPPKKFDILLLIGILCPLEIETCVNCLRMIKKLLKEDGCLIAGNAAKKMFREDPFTYFLMARIGNWKLVFKNVEELKQIFREGGYTWKGYFTDSYGFHIMGMGTPITSQT